MATDENKENNDKIYHSHKHGWYNKKDLRKEYPSIDQNIIPSITLTDFNDDKFLKQYQNKNKELDYSTHWLIPNIILVGEHPTYFVKTLLNDGFTKFISLYEWKHDYKKDIVKYAKNLDDIELIEYTIPDFEVRNDKETVRFIDRLIQNILTMNKFEKNEKPKDESSDEHKGNDDNMEKQTKHNMIYLHCLGGHGRTGLISGLLLQAIYGMDGLTAVKFINYIHNVRHPNESRIENGFYRMPESKEQLNQVIRLNVEMIKIYNKYLIKDDHDK